MLRNITLCLKRLLDISSLEVFTESGSTAAAVFGLITNLLTVGNILLKATVPSLSDPLAAARATLPPIDGLLTDGRVPDIKPYLRSFLARAYTRQHQG